VRTVETRRRSRYVLLVLSLLAVTLITLDSRGVGVFDGIRNTAGDVFAPVGDAFAWVTSPISNAWGGMSDYDDLKAENERLRQRVDELEGGEAEAANAVEQLERLQEQLQIEFVGDIPTQIARIATGPYSNFDTFRTEIDKGSDAGIREDMAVVTGAGLVGQVTEVSGNRSVVKLVSQRGERFGVRFADRPYIGVAEGRGDGQVISAEFPFEGEIATDDVLFTMGGVSTYPPDIPVGKVTAINEEPGSLRKTLDVELFADLNDLEFVQVVLWTPEPG